MDGPLTMAVIPWDDVGGIELSPKIAYGLRIYSEGNALTMHTTVTNSCARAREYWSFTEATCINKMTSIYVYIYI